MKYSFPAISRKKRITKKSLDEKPDKSVVNYPVLLSSLAVVISLLTFYFTNFRIDDHLAVKIIDIDVESKSDTLIKKDTLSIRFLYTNLGNRQALILGPHLSFRSNAQSDTSSGGISFWDKKLYPLVIEPRQTKIIQIDLPYRKFTSSIPDPWKGVYSGKETEIINGKNHYNVFLGITYFGINSSSKHIVKSSDFTIKLYFDDSEFLFATIKPQPESNNWYQNEPTRIF